jgi:hypothetical protein
MSAAIPTANWQADFIKVLPTVHTHAKIQFRRLRAEQREDAIQEAIASAYVSVQILAAKGRLQLARPSTIATYAVKHVQSGRHVGGRQDAAQDAMSPRARRRHRIHMSSLSGGEGLEDLLIADRKTAIPDLAAFRIDFGYWLSTFSQRHRRIISALASGASTSVVGHCFGISEGRVSQLRRQYEREWLRFQGQTVHTTPS